MENTRVGPRKPTIAMRVAVPADAAALRQLRLRALADNPPAFSADLETNRQATVENWEARITGYQRDAQGVIYLATATESAPPQRSQLVGMTGLYRGESPKTRHTATIWGVYVEPDFRGQRLSTALLEHCLDWGRANGVARVKLAVITTDLPAIRTYTRAGFTVYGIEPQAILYAGTYYDELLMSRLV